MDQRLIAGLGNLLVDEILWQARLHLRRAAASLTDAEFGRLFHCLRSVPRISVREGRLPTRPDWLVGVRGQKGARCPRCGAVLVRERVGGRSSYLCPREQLLGRPAADAAEVTYHGRGPR